MWISIRLLPFHTQRHVLFYISFYSSFPLILSYSSLIFFLCVPVSRLIADFEMLQSQRNNNNNNTKKIRTYNLLFALCFWGIWNATDVELFTFVFWFSCEYVKYANKKVIVSVNRDIEYFYFVYLSMCLVDVPCRCTVDSSYLSLALSSSPFFVCAFVVKWLLYHN